MNQATNALCERISLVATNPMRIAGLQGFYGDPCGTEFVPVSVSEALCLHVELDANQHPLILLDAGSVTPLFEVLSRFRLSCPQVRIIVIGTEADDTYIECVISAGAKGFLPATAPSEEFKNALDTVRDGAIWAPRKVLSRLIERRAIDRNSTANDGIGSVALTPRESEVLRLLVGGQGNREIGARLGIYPNTVKAHLGRIMRKAGVGNRVELTMLALHRKVQTRSDRSGPGASP